MIAKEIVVEQPDTVNLTVSLMGNYIIISQGNSDRIDVDVPQIPALIAALTELSKHPHP